jgi:GT2 family glycosyltransferase
MPETAPLDLAIVIPVFNQVELTRQCLASIDRHTTRRLRWRVIVIDNASRDETPAYLTEAQATYDWLTLVRNETNLGFAKASNQGARATDAPAILFLNNDTEVQPGWLEPMIRTLYAEPRVASVGSRLLFPDGTIQHAGVIVLDAVDRNDPILPLHIHFQSAGDLPKAQVRNVYPILTGACLLVKRQAFEAVGSFDEEYWNGYEDVDLCLSLAAAGGLNVYEPESVVIHYESQSGPERFRRVNENTRRLHEKWIGKVKPDLRVERGEVTPIPPSSVYPYRGADGVSFDDVLAWLEATPPSARNNGPAFARQRRSNSALPSVDGYNVVIIEPTGFEHSLAFLEVGELLVESLRTLGVSAKLQVNRFESNAINIVLGYQLLTDPSILRNYRHIIYQLEQLSTEEGWFRGELLEFFTYADAVWDYAPANIAFLRQRGISDVGHLPVGFHPNLRRIGRATQDIDVLFYGSINPRRRAHLEEINSFAKLTCLMGVYGQQRDQYIARAKIVLNLHYYEAQIMEQVRIAYLLNNHALVVSESSPENPFGQAIVTAEPKDLSATVRQLLDQPDNRYQRAKQGFALFRQRPMTEFLRPLLTDLPTAKASA